MTAIERLEILVARNVVVKEPRRNLNRHDECAQRHRFQFNGSQGRLDRGNKSFRKRAETVNIQRNLREVRFILGGSIRRKANCITEVMRDQARHKGIKIDYGFGFSRFTVEQDIIDLRIIVRYTQRHFLRVDQFVEAYGQRLEFSNPKLRRTDWNLKLTLFKQDASAFVQLVLL